MTTDGDMTLLADGASIPNGTRAFFDNVSWVLY